MKKITTILLAVLTFTMATGFADCKKNEPKELDMVEIPGKSIKMLKTEVTQKLYKSVMGENPSHFNGENNPVEKVSWNDAVYFCNKLSERFGYTPVYSVDGNTDPDSWGYTPHKGYKFLGDVAQNKNANGFRLPTEAEWEYAAKGGQYYTYSGTINNYTYSGSNNLDEVGWYYDNSGDKTHPVAQKKANGYGLYDMSGNVWEWCWDVNPKYSDGDYRYFRGGCYNFGDRYCRVSSRYGYYVASDRFDDVGFRVVCSAATGIADCKKNEPKELDMVEIPGKSIKMLKTEVTQKLYKSVMGENPSHFNGENNPVERVSWYDAIYFCNKLSEKFGFTPVYSVNGSTKTESWGYTPHNGNSISGEVAQRTSANGFRLPTEEEWEYAAKGGQNYTYSGSNNLDEVGWYRDNSGGKTHPVAQKKANGYGFYDMSGNVCEWCWDVSPNSSYFRYRRGGSYYDGGSYCGVSGRYYFRANDQDCFLGFRIVCSASN